MRRQEEIPLPELNSIQESLLEQKEVLSRKMEQISLKEAELKEKEDVIRRMFAEQERREAEFWIWLSFFLGFTALWHILGHFGRCQLT